MIGKNVIVETITSSLLFKAALRIKDNKNCNSSNNGDKCIGAILEGNGLAKVGHDNDKEMRLEIMNPIADSILFVSGKFHESMKNKYINSKAITFHAFGQKIIVNNLKLTDGIYNFLQPIKLPVSQTFVLGKPIIFQTYSPVPSVDTGLTDNERHLNS